MATKLSAKEAAKEIGTDARTLRKFIRGSKNLPISPVGQGARYEFTPKEVKALKKAFVAWSSGSKPKTRTNVDENGFSDEDYAEHQDIDIKTYEGTTAGEIDDDPLDYASEEDDDEDEKALDDLEGPSDEDLDDLDLDIEDIDLD